MNAALFRFVLKIIYMLYVPVSYSALALQGISHDYQKGRIMTVRVYQELKCMMGQVIVILYILCP